MKTKIILSKKEIDFRRKLNIGLVQNSPEKLKCTKCERDLTQSVIMGLKIWVHPLLEVLYCKECYAFYTDGDFSVDEDGEDKYCRWCGEGGTLYICSQCSMGFCPDCIERHFGREAVGIVRNDDEWQCYVCQPKPLWQLRAFAAATIKQISEKNGLPKNDTRTLRPGSSSRILNTPATNDIDLENSDIEEESNKFQGSDSDFSDTFKENKSIVSQRKKYTNKLSSERNRRNVNKKKFTYSRRNRLLSVTSSEEDEINDRQEKLKCSDDSDNTDSSVNKKKTMNCSPIAEYTIKPKLFVAEPSISEDEVNDCHEETNEFKKKSDRLLRNETENGMQTSQTTSKSHSTKHMTPNIKKITKMVNLLIVNCEVYAKQLRKCTQISKNMSESQAEKYLNDKKSLITSLMGELLKETQPKNNLDLDSEKTADPLRLDKSDLLPNDKGAENPKTTEDPQGDCFDLKKLHDIRSKVLLSSSSDSDSSENSKHSKNSKCQKKCRRELVLKRIKRSQDEDSQSESDTSDLNLNLSKTHHQDHQENSRTESCTNSNLNEKHHQDSESDTNLKENHHQDSESDTNLKEKHHQDSESDTNLKEINNLTNLSTLDRRTGKKSDMSTSHKNNDKCKKTEQTLLEFYRNLNNENENGAVTDESIDLGENFLFKHKTTFEQLFSSSDESDEFKKIVLDDSSDNDKKGEEDSFEPEVECEPKKTKKRKRFLLTGSSEDDSFELDNKKDMQAQSSSDDSDDLFQPKRKKFSSGLSSDGSSSLKKTVPSRKATKKRKKIANRKEIEESSDSDVVQVSVTPSKGGRRNIKAVMKEKALAVSTRVAVKNEETRKARLEERNKLYDQYFKDEVKRLILDFNESGEVLLEVCRPLVKRLKPHQRDGIKFMWDNCFESLGKMEESVGGGCILAHCMGLGKTLQVIALIQTVLSNDIGVKTVAVVCPLNTVPNWVNEFEIWLKIAGESDIDIYDMSKFKRKPERRFQLQTWHNQGGVLIISYDIFRNFTRNAKGVFETALLSPGPDLIICDEGHLLKNEKTMLSQCMAKVVTSRRIVLTGTPMQNNLKEYHCMVQFIKPNILGTMKEFLNRFVNPIENGQFEDSTEIDVILMKRRSHVLHTLLEGCIQRRDYSVLMPFLPEKHEYVISIALGDTLKKLYEHYLTYLSSRSHGNQGAMGLFHDYHELQRIWTHPLVLKAHFENSTSKKDRVDVIDDFIDDGCISSNSKSSSNESKNTTEEHDIICVDNQQGSKKHHPRLNPLAEENTIQEKEKPWWHDMVTEKEMEEIEISGKLRIFFSILIESVAIGDKVLVFSKSLLTLDLIEHFLNILNEKEGGWRLGLNYYRLDGNSNSENRASSCKAFNRPGNKHAKLFIISTKAGGLGINLVGANRVIIFDASWNPSHDLQSIFRIYRFGQEKPCFVYRFLAEGTMEEKIYERQVTKLSLAHRVVDEYQIERHYTMGNLQELYRFQPLRREDWKIPIVPKDHVLAAIVKTHCDIIVSYHEHDSLLENKQEEELTEEERKAAWEEYENSHTVPQQPDVSFQPQQVDSQTKSQMLQLQMQMQWSAAMNKPPPVPPANVYNNFMLQSNLNTEVLNKLRTYSSLKLPDTSNNSVTLNPFANATLKNPFAVQNNNENGSKEPIVIHNPMGKKRKSNNGTAEPIVIDENDLDLQKQRMIELYGGRCDKT